MSIAIAEEAVTEVAEEVTSGRLRLDIGGNLLDAILGYLVVFIGLTLLMCVVIIVGKIMVARMKKPAPAPETKAPEAAAAWTGSTRSQPEPHRRRSQGHWQSRRQCP